MQPISRRVPANPYPVPGSRYVRAATGRRGGPVLPDLIRGMGWTRLSYRVEAPFYLNAAIADFRHSRITIGGKSVRTVLGNFGGLARLIHGGGEFGPADVA